MTVRGVVVDRCFNGHCSRKTREIESRLSLGPAVASTRKQWSDSENGFCHFFSSCLASHILPSDLLITKFRWESSMFFWTSTRGVRVISIINISLASRAQDIHEGSFLMATLVHTLFLIPCCIAAWGVGQSISQEKVAKQREKQMTVVDCRICQVTIHVQVQQCGNVSSKVIFKLIPHNERVAVQLSTTNCRLRIAGCCCNET